MFPAWAGMNRSPGITPSSKVRVPRVGGDEPGQLVAVSTHDLVFPAWAGMNRPFGPRDQIRTGVPRVGGDEPLIWGSKSDPRACSPRGRG